MTDALIGFSGFVGSSLLRQRRFDALYRSTNIAEIGGGSFGSVVCAGAPAQKWIANREPAEDKAKIDALIGHLETIKCKRFVLVSTVDVFASPVAVDEGTAVDESDLAPYGAHRRGLERFVAQRFPGSLIVRLPGLVGPGLRKNIIFDLLNDNNVGAIDGRAVFQFYPMVNLWSDIEVSLKAGLDVVHLTAEPISTADVAMMGFGRSLGAQGAGGQAMRYDMRTRHADRFGAAGHYQYDRRASLLAIRSYAQSESRTALDRPRGA